jgi:quinol-cytochrome oxidoreductase complex cytochrome b subunit
VRQVLAKIGLSVAAGVVGLSLVFLGVERTSLLEAIAERARVDAVIPGSVYLTLVLGVFFLSIGVFSALTVLSKYLGPRPEARHVPVWILVTVIVAAGGLGLVAYAAHTDRIRSLAVVSLDVNSGFIAGQVLAATVVVAALVALGVRWTPRHRPARAQH